MKKIAMFILMVTVAGFSFAQEGNHPIDAQVQKLIDAANGTEDQVKAFAQGIELWNQELTRVYTKLLSSIEKDRRATELMVASQKAWIALRDADTLFLEQVFAQQGASMDRAMRMHDKMSIVRARALELGNRLILVNEKPAETEHSTRQEADQGPSRLRGTVKYYNETRGSGFIDLENGGETLFVYWQSIDMEGYKCLAAGEKVELTIGKGQFHAREALHVVPVR